MTFEEHYEELQCIKEQIVIKSKKGYDAYKDLEKANKDELFKLCSFWDNQFIFQNEDETKEIVVIYDYKESMIQVYPYMALGEILAVGLITYCKISLVETND